MKPDSSTLVLITPGFAATAADSTCLPLQQALVRAWKSWCPGLDVVVLALHYPYRTDSYTVFGARVIPFSGRNRGGLARLLRKRSALQALQDLHRSRRIAGIISCWYGEAAGIGQEASALVECPHYCWLLGQDARPANKWPQRVKLPALSLVALSEFLQHEFHVNYGICPAHIIEPGLEPAEADPVERTIDLLAVGSLIGLKRYPVFIRLVHALRKEYPQIRAVLAGAGPNERELQDMANEHGLKDHLVFAGELSHPEVRSLMKRARVFVHPSSYEGYSGVCMEALAAGTPVISFCAPSKLPVPGWQVVGDEVELLQSTRAILDKQATIKPFFRSIEETAKAWLRLFFGAQAPARISSADAIARAESVFSK